MHNPKILVRLCQSDFLSCGLDYRLLRWDCHQQWTVQTMDQKWWKIWEISRQSVQSHYYFAIYNVRHATQTTFIIILVISIAAILWIKRPLKAMSGLRQKLTLSIFCSIKYDTSIWWNSNKHSTNKRNNCCNPYSLSSSRSFNAEKKIKRSSHRMVIYICQASSML